MEAYRNTFTQEEVGAMLKFYTSPVGQSVGAKLPTASQQTMQLSLAGGWADIVADLVVEDNQPGGIALSMDRQIEERRREVTGIIHFVDAVGAELHGVAGVEQDGQHRVGFAAEALENEAFAAREDVPIDMAKIVAGSVGDVFGELLGLSSAQRANLEAREVIL